MRKAGLLALAGLLGGCAGEPQAVAPAARPPYFALNKFLDSQATHLNQAAPAVLKTVQLRNRQSETTRVPRVNWAQELQVFYQADISKPALRGAYAVDSAVTAAGMLRRTYTRQPGVEHPVRRLTVLSAGAEVQEIQAVVAQDNPLFYSEKRLVLHARQGTLTDYAVQGVQKLVLFDTLRYSAQAQLIR